MLLQLYVSNYALIDALHLNFETGFTSITGETGAGKSILLGALKLALGERADLSSIKNPIKKCIVEAQFDVKALHLESWFEENDVDYDFICILRRELLPNGKSRAFVNDTPVTLKFLQQLSTKLIDIHSQYDTSQLIEESFQLQSLDLIADQTDVVEKYTTLFRELIALRKQLDSYKKEQSEQLKQQDYNNYLLEELQENALDDKSEVSIEEEIQVLSHIDDSLHQLQQLLDLLDNGEMGIIAQIKQASSLGASLQKQVPGVDILSERLNSMYFESKDLVNEFEDWQHKLEPDPERLEELRNIWNQLQHLFAKHQVNSVSELLEIQRELENNLEGQAELEENIERLELEINNLQQQGEKIANEIHIKRIESKEILENKWMESLQQMSMEKAKFEFDITKRNELDLHGLTQLRLLFSANEGMGMKTLEKSISGGERSRVMLAIKKSMAEKMQLPTLIFDEIDTGVSGKVAAQMGGFQQQISLHTQVISITHLPQIAGMADQQMHVSKHEEKGQTSSEIRILNQDERVVEIARMLSAGDVTEAAKTQARSLMSNL